MRRKSHEVVRRERGNEATHAYKHILFIDDDGITLATYGLALVIRSRNIKLTALPKSAHTIIMDGFGGSITTSAINVAASKHVEILIASRSHGTMALFAPHPHVNAARAALQSFQTRYIGRRQGRLGELAAQFTARSAVHPMQAMLNYGVGIAASRMTRAIVARGLDPCFGFLHDGRKPGRFSLSWDAVEVFRPVLATAVFEYAAKKVFERADFASQDGVVRLLPWIARECAAVACKTAPLKMLVDEVRKTEKLL